MSKASNPRECIFITILNTESAIFLAKAIAKLHTLGTMQVLKVQG